MMKAVKMEHAEQRFSSLFSPPLSSLIELYIKACLTVPVFPNYSCPQLYQDLHYDFDSVSDSDYASKLERSLIFPSLSVYLASELFNVLSGRPAGFSLQL